MATTFGQSHAHLRRPLRGSDAAGWAEKWKLAVIVTKAELRLTDGFVDGFERGDAMAAKIMSPVLQMLAGFTEVGERGADFRMRLMVTLSCSCGLRLRSARLRRHGRGITKRDHQCDERQRTEKPMFHVRLLVDEEMDRPQMLLGPPSLTWPHSNCPARDWEKAHRMWRS